MIEKIRVKLKNHVYLQIDCDLGIKYELRDHFTFDVPGARYMPKFRAGVWDGKISLFNISTATLYAGVYDELLEFAKAREYEVELVESPYGLPGEKLNILPEDLVEYCKSLEVQSGNKDIKTRSYQYESVFRSLRDKRKTIVSPTGSGKSLIIYFIVRYLLDTLDSRSLIVVPTTSLVHQMKTDFEDYSTKNKFDVESNVHMIMGGYEKNANKKIFISTWQSLMRLPTEWFSKFDCVIIDECQGAKSTELQKLLEKCDNVPFRFGTTGSLSKSATHKMMIKGVLGPTMQVAKTKELMDKKQLSSINIKCIVLNHPNEVKDLFKKSKKKENLDQRKEYEREMDYIVSCEKRNKFIRNLALSLEGNTLILYRYVEKHGDVLNEMFLKKVGDRKYFYVHGSTAVEDREDVRKIVETSSNAIILASYGIFGAGTNIKRIHNVILASPSKSLVVVLQAIGRGLRLASDKTVLNLFDISDDMSYNNKKKNFTYKHMVERLNIYTSEEFPYTITKVDI